jgi:hypothetical protein
MAPVVLDDIWLPAALFRGLTAERLAEYKGPLYGLFETEFGTRMIRAEERIRAVAAPTTCHAAAGRRRRPAAAGRTRVVYLWRACRSKCGAASASPRIITTATRSPDEFVRRRQIVQNTATPRATIEEHNRMSTLLPRQEETAPSSATSTSRRSSLPACRCRPWCRSCTGSAARCCSWRWPFLLWMFDLSLISESTFERMAMVASRLVREAGAAVPDLGLPAPPGSPASATWCSTCTCRPRPAAGARQRARGLRDQPAADARRGAALFGAF